MNCGRGHECGPESGWTRWNARLQRCAHAVEAMARYGTTRRSRDTPVFEEVEAIRSRTFPGVPIVLSESTVMGSAGDAVVPDPG
jgi:hypothetical protein